MAERSKALVLGTSLRAWVRIPLVSKFCFDSENIMELQVFMNFDCKTVSVTEIQGMSLIYSIYKYTSRAFSEGYGGSLHNDSEWPM